jgi:hypothetical protein
VGHIKLDGGFHSHPTTMAMWDEEPGAIGLYVRMACYANKFKLREIPNACVSMFSPDDEVRARCFRAMENAGAAEITRDGIILSNYHEPVRVKRPDISPRLRAFIIERDERVCGLCGEFVALDDVLHLDHILPWSLGGTHHPDNLQVSHAACNLKKGASV